MFFFFNSAQKGLTNFATRHAEESTTYIPDPIQQQESNQDLCY